MHVLYCVLQELQGEQVKDKICFRCGKKFYTMDKNRKICVRCKSQADADVHLAVMAFAKEIGREYRSGKSGV